MKVLILTALCLLLPSMLSAQETEATPDAAADEASGSVFYSEALGYGLAIPTGWQAVEVEDDAYEQFTNGNASIYAMRFDEAEPVVAIEQALAQLDARYSATPVYGSEVNLTNGTWTQQVFRPNDDVSITALGQIYEGGTYVLLYVETAAASETIPLIVSSEDVQAGITAALQRVIDPAFAAESSITVVLDENPGGNPLVQNTYTLEDGDMLIAQGQVRGSSTYVVIQRGADLVDAADNAFFDALLGFFVTPQNTNYLLLALGAVALVVLLFIASMFVRYSNAQQDLAIVQQLNAEA